MNNTATWALVGPVAQPGTSRISVLPPPWSVRLSGGFVLHAPQVKSGTSIGDERFITDQSVSGVIELQSAAS